MLRSDKVFSILFVHILLVKKILRLRFDSSSYYIALRKNYPVVRPRVFTTKIHIVTCNDVVRNHCFRGPYSLYL
jgi:hypothetical protein